MVDIHAGIKNVKVFVKDGKAYNVIMNQTNITSANSCKYYICQIL